MPLSDRDNEYESLQREQKLLEQDPNVQRYNIVTGKIVWMLHDKSEEDYCIACDCFWIVICW